MHICIDVEARGGFPMGNLNCVQYIAILYQRFLSYLELFLSNLVDQ